MEKIILTCQNNCINKQPDTKQAWKRGPNRQNNTINRKNQIEEDQGDAEESQQASLHGHRLRLTNAEIKFGQKYDVYVSLCIPVVSVVSSLCRDYPEKWTSLNLSHNNLLQDLLNTTVSETQSENDTCPRHAHTPSSGSENGNKCIWHSIRANII